MMQGQRSEDYQTYMAQATQALKAARATLGWQDTTSSWLSSSIVQLPELGHWIKNRMGYEGAFIDNKTPKSEQAHWKITHKRFLP